MTASTRRLAINRLKERGALDAAVVDRFLQRYPPPIVEGRRCTFLFRGEADEVWVRHRVTGLPDPLPLRRLRGVDLWSVVLELPEGSRVEYQLEIRRGETYERINDPFNPHRSHSPVGSSSVVFATGYVDPEWARPDPETRPGELVELTVPSRALRRDARVTLYLPARFRRTTAYPLLVVHDGPDYLQYASAKTVLDNLLHRTEVAELVAAFLHPGDRTVEYADSTAHARFVTGELLPYLERRFPLTAQPAGRCLMGASLRGGRVAVDRVPAPGHVRVAAAAVRLVRVHRHRLRPRRRVGVRPGGPVHQPLPGPAPGGRGQGVRQLRGVRAADRPEPLDGPCFHRDRHAGALRRVPGRALLGELARPPA